MIGYAVGSGGVGLINVDALDRTAECDRCGPICVCGAFVDGFAADCVVKDEDLGSAGSGVRLVFGPLEKLLGAVLTLSSVTPQSRHSIWF
jgi:hypothetical protein